MTLQYTTVAELRRAISAEFLLAAGLAPNGLLPSLLRPLVWLPAHRFSRLAAEFDRRLAQSGVMAAVQWALPHFVDGVHAQGQECIPTGGPLVIASNHPGGADGLAVASVVARDDIKVVASALPFLRGLKASSRHIIWTTREPHERMTVVRESVRHLRDGGCLLIFAKGQVEPDPAVLPGAQESLQQWSPSLTLLLRQVPDARLLVSIVSGVLSTSCLSHPLARLRSEPRPRQLLAEFLQVSQQILFGRRFGLTPTVRLAGPLTAAELDGARDSKAALAAIIAQAHKLLGGP